MQICFSVQTLRYADERVRLYNQQGPGNFGLPRTYFDATQVAIADGDLARGRIIAEKAVERWRTAYGSDSKEMMEYSSIVRNSAKPQVYGLSVGWKTSLNEAPRELEPNDFEDWL